MINPNQNDQDESKLTGLEMVVDQLKYISTWFLIVAVALVGLAGGHFFGGWWPGFLGVLIFECIIITAVILFKIYFLYEIKSPKIGLCYVASKLDSILTAGWNIIVPWIHEITPIEVKPVNIKEIKGTFSTISEGGQIDADLEIQIMPKIEPSGIILDPKINKKNVARMNRYFLNKDSLNETAISMVRDILVVCIQAIHYKAFQHKKCKPLIMSRIKATIELLFNEEVPHLDINDPDPENNIDNLETNHPDIFSLLQRAGYSMTENDPRTCHKPVYDVAQDEDGNEIQGEEIFDEALKTREEAIELLRNNRSFTEITGCMLMRVNIVDIQPAKSLLETEQAIKEAERQVVLAEKQGTADVKRALKAKEARRIAAEADADAITQVGKAEVEVLEKKAAVVTKAMKDQHAAGVGDWPIAAQALGEGVARAFRRDK